MLGQLPAEVRDPLLVGRVADEVVERIGVLLVIVELLGDAVEEELDALGNGAVVGGGGLHGGHGQAVLGFVLEHQLAIGPAVVDIAPAGGEQRAHRVVSAAGGAVEVGEDPVAAGLFLAAQERPERASVHSLEWFQSQDVEDSGGEVDAADHVFPINRAGLCHPGQADDPGRTR